MPPAFNLSQDQTLQLKVVGHANVARFRLDGSTRDCVSCGPPPTIFWKPTADASARTNCLIHIVKERCPEGAAVRPATRGGRGIIGRTDPASTPPAAFFPSRAGGHGSAGRSPGPLRSLHRQATLRRRPALAPAPRPGTRPEPRSAAPRARARDAAALPGALARISHQLPAADADPCAVTGRTPSSRFDVVSTTPSASFGPCGPPQRRLGALATKVGELSGLSEATPEPVAGTRSGSSRIMSPGSSSRSVLAPTAEEDHSQGRRGQGMRALRISLKDLRTALRSPIRSIRRRAPRLHAPPMAGGRIRTTARRQSTVDLNAEYRI